MASKSWRKLARSGSSSGSIISMVPGWALEYLLARTKDAGILPDLMILNWAKPYGAGEQICAKLTSLTFAWEPHLLQYTLPPRTCKSWEEWVNLCPICIMLFFNLIGIPLLAGTGLHDALSHSREVVPMSGKLHMQTMQVTRASLNYNMLWRMREVLQRKSRWLHYFRPWCLYSMWQVHNNFN